MVTIHSRTDEERELCDKAIAYLRESTEYNKSNSILAHKDERSVSISYWTAENQRVRDQTKISIQIIGNTCDVLGILVKESDWRNGRGRTLYQGIENFARDLGCTRMQTTPSGMGKLFFPAMGFNTPCAVGLEKTL